MFASFRRSSLILALAFLMGFILIFAVFPFPKASASVSHGEEVASLARHYEGKPFSWGGSAPSGFDASGFTLYVYKKAPAHITLPHNSKQQASLGKPVSKLQPGDLVFFATGKKRGEISFVGIYTGGERFTAATSSGVKSASLKDSYWKERYMGARRVLK